MSKPSAGDEFRSAFKKAEKAAHDAKAAATRAEAARREKRREQAKNRKPPTSRLSKWFAKTAAALPKDLEKMTKSASKGTLRKKRTYQYKDKMKDLERAVKEPGFKQLDAACKEADIALTVKTFDYKTSHIESGKRHSQYMRGGITYHEYEDSWETVFVPHTGISVTVEPGKQYSCTVGKQKPKAKKAAR